jgi:hypothetical protein
MLFGMELLGDQLCSQIRNVAATSPMPQGNRKTGAKASLPQQEGE